MTKIAKLVEKLRDDRALTFAEFIRLIEAFGFRRFRTRGSHQIYGREDIPDQISIQPRGKDAKAYQVRQLSAIIRKYGLTPDDRE